MKKLGFVLFMSMFAFVSVVPAAEAKVIDHDKVQGFSEVTPVTVSQKAAKRFQPYLKVASGCVPFPVTHKATQAEVWSLPERPKATAAKAWDKCTHDPHGIMEFGRLCMHGIFLKIHLCL